jgi:UDP-N-acetylglucosamine acyltransferase
MTHIHPTAVIYQGVEVGENVYIGAFCVIGAPPEHDAFPMHIGGMVIICEGAHIDGASTIDSGTESYTVIGANTRIMKQCHVGHDATIGQHVHLAPGAKIGGHAEIGDYANIGLNATVHQNVTVPPGCMIGQSCAVVKSTQMQPFQVYAGVPAHHIRENTKAIDAAGKDYEKLKGL